MGVLSPCRNWLPIMKLLYVSQAPALHIASQLFDYFIIFRVTNMPDVMLLLPLDLLEDFCWALYCNRELN